MPLPFSNLSPYLNTTLKHLWLPTAARNDFITYRLPKLAIRFLPQSACDHAAILDAEPKPDVVAHVSTLFRGITSEVAGEQICSVARARVGEVDWVKIAGVYAAARDERQFRVLGWGGMEVL